MKLCLFSEKKYLCHSNQMLLGGSITISQTILTFIYQTMKKFNFFNSFFATMLIIATMAFVGCVDDNDDTEAPYLEVSPTTLVFTTNGTPVEGSQSSFNISTNRHWKATVKDDKSWVTLSKTEGDGSATIQVSIPENISDEASVIIEISNKVGPLKSEVVTIRSGNVIPETVIYKETVGTAAVANPFPEVGAYAGWNKTGIGAADVTYTGVKATVRASGLSNIGTAGPAYDGASGPNVVFFGTLPANFEINNITLAPEQTNLKLTFGGSYSFKPEGATDYDNTFDASKFVVSLSADGIAWTPLTYTKNNGDSKSPFWVLATADFTLKQATTKLFIKFTALAPSAFRLDDITLSTGNGGQEISFGDAPEPGEEQVITIPELIAMMTTSQVPVDATADRFFEAIVQNDVAGNNYSFNNLILTTENATTAGNGITLYGSQVEPTVINVNKGDRVKVTLFKGLAQVVNYNGMYEVTGAKDATWAKVEKIGTPVAITPIVITADKLADYQGMPVTIQDATTAEAGVWANTEAISPHTFTVGATPFTVFCKKDATAFLGQPYQVATGSISGLAAVNNNSGQLVPRNLADVATFNSTASMIVSVDPESVTLPGAGGTKAIEVTVVNQGTNALSVSGLSGILSATVSGTTVTVTATANNTSDAINQTLTISLANGNTKTVPVTVAAQGSSDGYTLISAISDLTAGKYLMSGYVEKNNNNEDLTPYTYQIWTGSVSFTGTGTTSNSDLKTVSYQYENNQLTPKNSAEVATTEVELVAVSGKANTYYIKVGNQYLYNSVSATNRRLYFQDTIEGSEWVFMNKSNGTGITASNNATYLITAGATYDYIRSYKTETQTKVGIFFFKKN